jgi:hypothetical protein
MMMQNPTRFLHALCAITLLNASIVGCAQKSFAQKENVQQINAQSEGCRSCHAPNAAGGARDLSPFYANPKSHHPVGVNYPASALDDSKFKLPNGRSADIVFFDRNGNGQPDSDEIQLFGAKDAVTVECASCHKEHGGLPASGSVSSGFYLRVANVGSALCLTCHRL